MAIGRDGFSLKRYLEIFKFVYLKGVSFMEVLHFFLAVYPGPGAGDEMVEWGDWEWSFGCWP